MDSSSARYSLIARLLHWLMALGLVGLFALGTYMADLPSSPDKLRLYNWHKWAGVIALSLVLLRLLWRLTHTPPPLPAAIAPWKRRAASIAHVALYVMLFVVPLVGWAYSSAAGYPVVLFGVWPLPDFVSADRELARAIRPWHERSAWLLAALVGLHVLGLLSHVAALRRSVWRRMAPWIR